MPVIGKNKLHKNQVHKLDIQKHRLLFLFLNLFYDSVHKLCGANIGILFGLVLVQRGRKVQNSGGGGGIIKRWA